MKLLKVLVIKLMSTKIFKSNGHKSFKSNGNNRNARHHLVSNRRVITYMTTYDTDGEIICKETFFYFH